jgi:prepilin peptidase CpaA
LVGWESKFMGTLALWPVVIVVAVATITDLCSRRIPNWLTLPFLAAGLAAGSVLDGWSGLARSAAGAGLAALILSAFCLLRGMGWGDLKLCAAVGAWIGPGQMGFALVATAIAGGLVAVAVLLWRGIGHKLPARLTLDDPAAFKLPYAPVIAIGTLFSFLQG